MNPIADLLPPRVRQILYALLFLAALVFGIYQASEGDWELFAGGVVTALVGLLAAGNTSSNAPPADPLG